MYFHESHGFRRIALLATGVSASLLLAACGGAAEETPPAPQQQAAPTVTESTIAPATSTSATTPTQPSVSPSASATPSDRRQVPSSVMGGDASNFRLGGTEPGSGTPKDVLVEASGRMLQNGGFTEAWMRIPSDGANGVLQFPLVDGTAEVQLHWRFEGNTQATCESGVEVYDSNGDASLFADAWARFDEGRPCLVESTGMFMFGEAAAEFTEPGEYYIVVHGGQSDYDQIRIAQKVLITSGEVGHG